MKSILFFAQHLIKKEMLYPSCLFMGISDARVSWPNSVNVFLTKKSCL